MKAVKVQRQDEKLSTSLTYQHHVWWITECHCFQTFCFSSVMLDKLWEKIWDFNTHWLVTVIDARIPLRVSVKWLCSNKVKQPVLKCCIYLYRLSFDLYAVRYEISPCGRVWGGSLMAAVNQITLIAQPEGSAPLIPKPVIRHEPGTVWFTSHQNLYPENSS